MSVVNISTGNPLITICQSNGKIMIYTASADTDVERGNALVDAFNASSSGDIISIGIGNYSISSTLSLKESQTVIIDGNIISTNNTINVFTCIDVSHWKIKGSGTITGAGLNSGGVITDECGIYIHSSDDNHYVANYIIEGLTFRNFKGCAIFSDAHPSATPWDKNGSILNCFITSNNYGIYYQTNWGAGNDYMIMSGNRINYNNNKAISIYGGNTLVSNNVINKNPTGIYLGEGFNDGHGIISNNDINHNDCGIYCDTLRNGESINENHIINNGVSVYLNSTRGVNINGGYIDIGNIVMNGVFDQYNYVRNVYSYTDGIVITATSDQLVYLKVSGCATGTIINPPYNTFYNMNLPTYANDAAAGAAVPPLVKGDLYQQTSTGLVAIKQ